jgi:hypothetical protein
MESLAENIKEKNGVQTFFLLKPHSYQNQPKSQTFLSRVGLWILHQREGLRDKCMIISRNFLLEGTQRVRNESKNSHFLSSFLLLARRASCALATFIQPHIIAA